MDWDKLRTFHHAAECGSLTAAAERLDLSQSAVSRQIAALEDRLHLPLFQRHARGLILTEAGRILQRATREMAAHASLAESALKEAADRPVGSMLVTAPVAFGSAWLVPRLPGFFRRNPDVRIELMLDDREYDILKLEAEAAIRLWPATHADLIQRKIMEVTTSLYAAPGYLARMGMPRTAADLDAHQIVSYAGATADNPMRDVGWASFVGREGGKPRPATLELNNVAAMVRAVEAGLGIASLPDYMAVDSPGLVRVLPELAGPTFEVYFIYSSDLRRSKRIAALRQFLIEEANPRPGVG
jgi:DNA-binding transcriptional LysR family regulator